MTRPPVPGVAIQKGLDTKDAGKFSVFRPKFGHKKLTNPLIRLGLRSFLISVYWEQLHVFRRPSLQRGRLGDFLHGHIGEAPWPLLSQPAGVAHLGRQVRQQRLEAVHRPALGRVPLALLGPRRSRRLGRPHRVPPRPWPGCATSPLHNTLSGSVAALRQYANSRTGEQETVPMAIGPLIAALRQYPQPDSNRCIQTENLMS